MVMAWNGRVSALASEGAKVGFTYNQGILQSTSLCILKDAPNLSTAVRFLNEAVDPVNQANLPLHIDYGPANPKAFDTGVIKPERAAQLPSAPDNTRKQALMSYAWWSSPEGEAAEKRWVVVHAEVKMMRAALPHLEQTGRRRLTSATPGSVSLRHHRREQGMMLALALPALLVMLLLHRASGRMARLAVDLPRWLYAGELSAHRQRRHLLAQLSADLRDQSAGDGAGAPARLSASPMPPAPRRRAGV